MNIHIFINIEIKSQANALLSISWLAIINTLAEPAQLCLAAFTPEQEKCGVSDNAHFTKDCSFPNWLDLLILSAVAQCSFCFLGTQAHQHLIFLWANFRHSNGRSHGNNTYIFHSTEEAQLFLFPLLHKQVSCSFNCMWKKLAQEVSPGTQEIEVVRFL